jgi:hypothetical protein
MATVRANESFTANGRIIVAGLFYDDTDPIVKGREALFSELDVVRVEQATAAPGEKRSTKVRK